MRFIFAIVVGLLLPTYSVGDPMLCPIPHPGLDGYGILPDQCEQCCHCIPSASGDGSCPDPGTSPRTAFEYTVSEIPQFYGTATLQLSSCYPILFPPSCQPFPDVAGMTGQTECTGVMEYCPPGSSSDSDSSDDNDPPVCALDFTPHCDGTGSDSSSSEEDEFGTYRFFSGSKTDAENTPNVHIHHEESCGVCSFPQDLAANMNPALDCESFKCILHYSVDNDFENLVGCYGALGFSDQCSYLWGSNALNSFLAIGSSAETSCQACASDFGSGGFPDDPDEIDRINCGNPFDVALPRPNDPETCELSACLQCDELVSGPFFKSYAGLTRRRAGIVTATDVGGLAGLYLIGTKRDCDTIADIQHPGFFDICNGNESEELY